MKTLKGGPHIFGPQHCPFENKRRSTVLELLLRRHGMHVQIKGTSVTEIEDALLIPTFQRMWGLPRQTDICWGIHPLPRSIGRNVGKCPFQPNVNLVTRMAMVRNNILWGRSQEDFTSALGEI